MSVAICTIMVVSFNILFNFFIQTIPSFTKLYHINIFIHKNTNNINPISYQLSHFVCISLYSKIHLVIFKVNNL